jgi:hypothetical protein
MAFAPRRQKSVLPHSWSAKQRSYNPCGYFLAKSGGLVLTRFSGRNLTLARHSQKKRVDADTCFGYSRPPVAKVSSNTVSTSIVRLASLRISVAIRPLTGECAYNEPDGVPNTEFH